LSPTMLSHGCQVVAAAVGVVVLQSLLLLSLPGRASGQGQTLSWPNSQLTPEQKKEAISRMITKFGDKMTPSALASLYSALNPKLEYAPHPDLVKDRLLHSWAENNVTCKIVKICMSLEPYACRQVCEDGSVKIDPWLAFALKTQREIQYDVPLNRVSMPSTHNSAITMADGYGLSEDFFNGLVHLISSDWQVYIANQQLGLTDQYNLGVRHFELDIHWWVDAIRICHAGGVNIQALDDLVAWIKEVFGIQIEWDSKTIGCFSPYDRTLNATFV